MKTALPCVPCLVRQTGDVLEQLFRDPEVRKRAMRETLRTIAEADYDQSPPALAAEIHRRLRVITGEPDPYRRAKARMNWLGLQLLPAMERRVAAADKPREAALRAAMAGNIIDSGVNARVTRAQILRTMDEALHASLYGVPAQLFETADRAESILYLADNAGEIVFDQLLLERLPAGRVTVAVRGAPVLNDATYADAVAVGLVRNYPVITNGSSAPGTILTDCSANFRQSFEAADLIIAKGQGNYETLNDTDRPVAFALKAKCPVVADKLGCDVGTMVLHMANVA